MENMRLNNKITPRRYPQGRCGGIIGQSVLPLFVSTIALFVASCGGGTGGGSTFNFSDVGDLTGFVGGVVSDEPQATLIGRDILTRGGSAADAAVATYFALAVTYPGAASLGGGGACVVYDRAGNKGYALDFLPKSAAKPGAVAVPGNARGMAALQARFGKLRWGQVVAPAETLASVGHPLSRATAREFAVLAPELMRDSGLAAAFGSATGEPLKEGERAQLRPLGSVIAGLRTSEGSDLYAGTAAERLLRDAAAFGGTLTAEDLRSFVPTWSEPQKFEYDNVTMMTPARLAAAGTLKHLWDTGVRGPGLLDSRGSFDRIRLALAVGQGSSGATNPDDDTASTGFAAIDSFGRAVACVVTMLRPFGIRHAGGETGVLLAPDPAAVPEELASLTPIVGANLNVKQIFIAASATGGAAAPAALTEVLATAMTEKTSLERAEALPRFYRAGNSVPLSHEADLDPKLADALRRQGIALAPAMKLGRVNTIHCSDGMPRSPDTCRYAVDPRGFGYAAGGRQ
jgi:gamma-glutamyltranspeptidase/glutathione hydrolase